MKTPISITRRRGIALVDVIIGSVILAIGLAVVISLTTRSLRTQTDGEKQLMASWLVDEFLTMVLVEGPINYPKLYDTNGTCEYPFEEFDYDVAIEDMGPHQPFRVTATVYWLGGTGERQVQAQTFISERGGDPYQPRIPLEPVDRDARWNENEDQ
jgi:hypothetical protein